jgi:predicted flap endonuclease-1-like 5' DNA nuclease
MINALVRNKQQKEIKMSRNRPLGVTILAVLAAIAAIVAAYHTLQMLGLFRVTGPFGQVRFFTFDFFGALLWGILALIYLWVMNKLWNLDPRAWLFVAALSALNLILAVVSIFGQSTFQAMLPAIIVNGLILVYVLLPGTKEAFSISPETFAEPASPTPVEPAPEKTPGTAGMDMAEGVSAPEPETGMSSSQAMDEAMAADMQVTGKAAASHDLAYVEGIGEVYAEKLKEAGVDSPQALLERGATPKGRQELAEAGGISEHRILEWVNHVDLYRIKGVGSEYADLLEASGVDTVVELAQRNPANLFEKLNEVNAEKSLVRRLPTSEEVEDWVAQAKSLPRVISY